MLILISIDAGHVSEYALLSTLDKQKQIFKLRGSSSPFILISIDAGHMSEYTLLATLDKPKQIFKLRGSSSQFVYVVACSYLWIFFKTLLYFPENFLFFLFMETWVG